MARHKNPVWIIVLIICCAMTALAQQSPEIYSEVKIHLQNQQQIETLAQAGLIFDHVHVEKTTDGVALTTVVNSVEQNALASSGVAFDVLIEDMSKAYLAKPQLSAAERRQIRATNSVQGFEFGSMGGFYTLAEAETELDSMRMLYPNLITAKQSVGLSREGRNIWMVKISDNPEVDEAEPEVLYDALHHAREPESLMANIYFMYYLLENYGSDPEVTYLVDNRELYFVPVVNPDGYVYNQSTNPNGGGFWRKNRRNNGNGTMGVDLNRNYGHEWGYDNTGSSPNSSSDTYRGPSAFSEPETQAMRDFCNSRDFKLALNYHTYSDLLIYPWGYIASFLTPDSAVFIEYASDMTQFNGYTYGTGDQTVGYLVNGDSDDWMYGEQTSKNKILAMTPEVGSFSDGFWPSQSRIYPLAEENVYPNLFAAWAAGEFVKQAGNHVIDTGNQNGYIDAGETVKIVFDVKNFGLSDAANVSFTLNSSDPYITVISNKNNQLLSIPARGEITTDTLIFSVAGNAPAAHQLSLNLDITFNGYTRSEVVNGLIVGTPTAAFSSDAESGVTGWSTGQSWNTTTSQFVSPSQSFTDSPTGNYGNNIDNSLTLQNPVDLTDAAAAYLVFWTRWDIESTYDFAQAEASSDGVNWTPLSGLHTDIGTGSGVQTSGEPGYDGTQTTWLAEQMDLSAYVGQQVYLRFRLRSDVSVTGDGWYVDDVAIQVYNNTNSFSAPLSRGWNLISLPLNPPDANYQSLFPNATAGTLFRYDGSYISETTLTPGNGYWLNFAAPESVPVSGDAITSVDINLQQGWNLIGGASCNIALADVADPGNIIVPNTLFGFDGAYISATQIEQGRGYWVNATQAGTITISCIAALDKSPGSRKNNRIDFNNANVLEIHDATGAAQTLYFDVPQDSDIDVRQFQLPPVPPADLFDARFADNSRATTASEANIRVQTKNYPVSIFLKKSARQENELYQLVELVGNQTIKKQMVEPGSEVLISDARINRVRLQKMTANPPAQFLLAQNFPNPFNPETQIEFALPAAERVKIIIYNALGQQVKTLVDGVREAGVYRETWDGTNENRRQVSSGIYIYQITAGGFTARRKMLLLR